MRALPLALALSIASIATVSPAASVARAAGASAVPVARSTKPHPAHHRRKPKPHKVPSRPAVAPPSASTPAPLVSCPDTDLVPVPGNLDRVSAATLCLINQQRALAGLTGLHRVAAMTTAATFHSYDMVALDYFAQVSPAAAGPLQRLIQTGYVRPDTAVDISEILAATTGTASTPAATVASWMSSPSSRAVIQSARFTDTGIGVAAAAPAVAGSGPGATYTADFGGTS